MDGAGRALVLRCAASGEQFVAIGSAIRTGCRGRTPRHPHRGSSPGPPPAAVDGNGGRRLGQRRQLPSPCAIWAATVHRPLEVLLGDPDHRRRALELTFAARTAASPLRVHGIAFGHVRSATMRSATCESASASSRSSELALDHAEVADSVATTTLSFRVRPHSRRCTHPRPGRPRCRPTSRAQRLARAARWTALDCPEFGGDLDRLAQELDRLVDVVIDATRAEPASASASRS